jgi:hypothetical protein
MWGSSEIVDAGLAKERLVLRSGMTNSHAMTAILSPKGLRLSKVFWQRLPVGGAAGNNELSGQHSLRMRAVTELLKLANGCALCAEAKK